MLQQLFKQELRLRVFEGNRSRIPQALANRTELTHVANQNALLGVWYKIIQEKENGGT